MHLTLDHHRGYEIAAPQNCFTVVFSHLRRRRIGDVGNCRHFPPIFVVPDLLPLISDSRHLRPRNSWLFNGQLDVVLHNKRCNGSRPRTVKHSFIFHATETFWYCY